MNGTPDTMTDYPHHPRLPSRAVEVRDSFWLPRLEPTGR